MTDRAMDAVVLWEAMLEAIMQADKVEEYTDGCLGDYLIYYRENNGICETRQLAVDLAEPADAMWQMFTPAHDCDRSFDYEWAPAWLEALNRIAHGLENTSRHQHIIAGIIASYGIDMSDDDRMYECFHSLRSFHTEAKMLLRDPKDGKLYVENDDPDDPDALSRFWGIYGLDQDDYAMHVVDVQTEAQAREVIDALNKWLNRKSYRVVEELPDGTDNVLMDCVELFDAERLLTRYLNLGHDAYLQEETAS